MRGRPSLPRALLLLSEVDGLLVAADACDVGCACSLGRHFRALYRWATVEESPDRVLAARQVISLYDTEHRLLNSGFDIQRAAEPIYVALRSSTVAEVFAANRDARNQAAEAARRSSDAALAAAKTVAERVIAALLAIGVLVITKAASTSVSNDLFGTLAVGVGSFLLALAAWAYFIERHFITTPISAFLADLDRTADLLSESQRGDIRQLAVLELARKRTNMMQWMPSLIYLVMAALALWLAFHQPGAVQGSEAQKAAQEQPTATVAGVP